MTIGGSTKKFQMVSKTQNPYLIFLIKLYHFLVRRVHSKFNRVVRKRLVMSRVNRPSLSIASLSRFMKGKGGIAVVVGTVTDDLRSIHEIPNGLKVCALRFTETSRHRINEAGGQCLTFDQLALLAPNGSRCTLLRGKKKTREAVKHFGPAPGVPGSKTRPYVRSYGNKFEKARGRR